MPVQMVDLVTEAARNQLLAVVFIPVAVSVLCAHRHIHRARDHAVLPRQTQAALHAGLLLFAFGHELGIHQLHDLVADVHHHEPAQHAHLRRGKPHAVGVSHRLLHIVDELRQTVVKFYDRAAFFRQNGVTHGDNIPQSHLYFSSQS